MGISECGCVSDGVSDVVSDGVCVVVCDVVSDGVCVCVCVMLLWCGEGIGKVE